MKFKFIQQVQKGFTLIELIIIVLILGIISIIVMPRITNLNSLSIKVNKDKVLVLLRTAQKTAITQRRDIYVFSNNNILSLCYINSKPCPDNQTVLMQNKDYSINFENTIIKIPLIKFNSEGNTSSEKINIKINDKDIYIEEDSGYIH